MRAIPKKLFLLLVRSNFLCLSFCLPAKLAGGAAKDVPPLGNPMRVSEKDFSITPPMGWEVLRNQPGTSLVMQIPLDKSVNYRRTIQIMTFKGPAFLDEVGARDFADEIEKKFSNASIGITNYRIRNHLVVKTALDRPAVLFYSEFNFEGLALMQAHLLVSNSTHHYLVTFTDVQETFESADRSQVLKTAWESMVSFDTIGTSPERYDSLYFGIAIASLIGVCAVALWTLRAKKESQNLMRIAEDEEDVDIELAPNNEQWSVNTDVDIPSETEGETDEFDDINEEVSHIPKRNAS